MKSYFVRLHICNVNYISLLFILSLNAFIKYIIEGINDIYNYVHTNPNSKGSILNLFNLLIIRGYSSV